MGWYNKVRLIDSDRKEVDFPLINGVPRVASMPYTFDIAEGNVSGHTPWGKLGYNSDIQTAEEIVSPQGGTYVFPTAEMQLYAIMDSASDRNLATGLWSARVYYLTDDYVEKTTDVTLNAASVALSVSDTFRINNVRAMAVGVAGKAVGNIKIANAEGTVTYGYIAAGNTRQRQFVYTVPAGKTLYITQANLYAIHSAANKRAMITLRANYDEKLGAKISFFMAHAEAILSDNPIAVTYTMPKKFPEKVDVIVVGNSNGTASFAIAMAGWLETN
jgi:hypothetical protein